LGNRVGRLTVSERTAPNLDVTLHELVEQAPQSADVTLTLDEEMFSRTHISREVPVFAEHRAPDSIQGPPSFAGL